MMAGLKATLTRKVGPLPVWAWGAAGLGGVALSYYLKRRADVATVATVPMTGAGTAGDTFPSGFGDSAIPVDTTGPAPLPDPGDVGGGGYPVPEPIFIPDPNYTGGDVPPTPDVAPRPEPIFQPPQPPVKVPPVSQPWLPAIQGGYASAPNRECPLGWHKATSGQYAGKCIQNVR